VRSISGFPYATLWEWRRTISELYAEVRSSDPVEGWHRWRRVRDRLFRDHPQSPLAPRERAPPSCLTYFEYDPSLRFTVDLDEVGDATTGTIAAAADDVVTLVPFARTRGLEQALGAELTLFWIEGYGGGVFLPFGDQTNGRESFGGGRYLLDTIKGADLGWTGEGRIVLDFNFAYHPSCAYADRWVCPLTPPRNRLERAIRAGERL